VCDCISYVTGSPGYVGTKYIISLNKQLWNTNLYFVITVNSDSHSFMAVAFNNKKAKFETFVKFYVAMHMPYLCRLSHTLPLMCHDTAIYCMIKIRG